MPALNELYGGMQFQRPLQVWDDFAYYTTTVVWTSLAADGGSSVAHRGDVAGGFVTLTTGAVDNNECAVRSTNEIFLIDAGQALVAVANIVVIEAATNVLNLAFGFSNVLGADLLLDDGAGPKVTGTHVLIYKLDGGTAWVCQTRNGAGATTANVQTNTSSTTRTAGGAASTFRIEIKELDSTTFQATFFVNREQLLDATTLKPIVHTMLDTSATEMKVGVYVKAGDGTGEVIHVDYLGASQQGVHNAS